MEVVTGACLLYYQVQVQLNVCNVKYGDFVLWTENGLATERIIPDSAFYDAAACNVEHLFTYGILPEINGKWYTRKAVANETGVLDLPKVQESPEEEDPEKLWCFCGEPSLGYMITCDNPHCTIQWFHFDCLRICCAPKGKWYCPSCCKLLNFNCSRRGKQKQSVSYEIEFLLYRY